MITNVRLTQAHVARIVSTYRVALLAPVMKGSDLPMPLCVQVKKSLLNLDAFRYVSSLFLHSCNQMMTAIHCT